MADDVRKMGMEHKGEISQGFSHDILLLRPVVSGGKRNG
jgi:hypothetical protein